MADKKKYKQKYKSKRDDYRKGGRVQARRGGLKKAPTEKIDKPMSIERKPIKKVKPVKEQKPLQPISETSIGSGNQTTMTRQELDKLEGNTNSVGNNQIDIARGPTLDVRPTVQPTTPVQPTPTFQQAPVEPKRPDVVEPTEQPVTPTFQQAPVEPKRPDVVQPKQQILDEPITTTTTTRTLNVGDTRTINGTVFVWTGSSWVPTSNSTTEEIIGDIELTDEQKETKFQSDRKTRILETAQQAQQMAQGVMPEDIPTIPDPDKIDRTDTEITPEQAAQLQMEATKQAEAATIGAVSPEQVSTIQDVATAAAPKPFAAATLGDEDISKVPEDAVVEAASGSVSPEVSETLAKAAGIERVAPIDAAEVEVIPGALQERVVGTISKEAKAQAAKVAGTSLAKITRAKKQLRNAGLSESEIAEIGNDPEDLEARLTDFTEEQRGIIEGLPEEALVSTQINGLLEGMENGEIPIWARPAVASVEAMLAQRGMSASTVGRDALLNAIMTSALPIAQSNAQAIQASVSQQKSIEATAALKDAEMAQQTALFNAQNVFQLDMAQFSADQQRAINNSKFLQTASLQNATASQQAVMQDAILMSQMNLAEADQNTKLAITNAQAFLQMDMANLNNAQQASMLKAQQIQQRLLSNQSAENAAAQFNATSQNQVNQFMESIKQQNEQYNASQLNAMNQFNAQQKNAAEARRANREAQAEIIEAQLQTDVEKFTAQQEFAREQFNVQNATAIAQSNVEWRRKANTADTAAANAVAQKNAQNAFQLTAAANNFLWQELRDEADFEFKRWDNDQQRKASLLIAALGNESGVGKQDVWDDSLRSITSILDNWLD